MSEALAAAPQPWFLGRMASLDLETTSPNPEEARIVQACFALVGGGQDTQSTTWLVDPHVEIPAEAAAIHGITTERARAEGQDPRDVVQQLVDLIATAADMGRPIVIMNAPYDLTVVAREAARHFIEPPPATGFIIDPKVLDKVADDYVGFHRKGKRQLTDLCAHYGAKLDGAHDAAFDAIAAARVAYRIGQRFPQLGAMPLDQLQELQRRAYWEQANSLNQYWIKKKDERRVDNYQWPVREWKGAST